MNERPQHSTLFSPVDILNNLDLPEIRSKKPAFSHVAIILVTNDNKRGKIDQMFALQQAKTQSIREMLLQTYPSNPIIQTMICGDELVTLNSSELAITSVIFLVTCSISESSVRKNIILKAENILHKYPNISIVLPAGLSNNTDTFLATFEQAEIFERITTFEKTEASNPSTIAINAVNAATKAILEQVRGEKNIKLQSN